MRTRADMVESIDRVFDGRESSGDQSSDVTDLLTDIMHWCASRDLDFEDCARLATTHFESEEADES